jgi:hypothetical protein
VVVSQLQRLNVRVMLLACLLLGACATAPEPTWLRVDGKPVSDLQFEADQAACRGEMQKAKLSSNMESGVVLGPNGLYSPRQNAISDVYSGCMAQRGYVQRAAPSAVPASR